MRIILAAAIIVALTGSSYSQSPGRGGGRQQQQADPQAESKLMQKRRNDAELEKASKSAIDKLPDQKFDPWRTTREKAPAK
jgi:hypothetical protein